LVNQLCHFAEKTKVNEGQTQNLNGYLIRVEQLPEYVDTLKKRNALNLSLQEVLRSGTADTSGIDKEISGVTAEIERSEKVAAAIKARDDSLAGIKAMEVEEKRLAGELEGVDQELAKLNKGILDQASSLKSKINNLFEFNNYKMFDYTLENEVVECCECVNKQGVGYQGFSPSEERRAGLDAIRQLSRFYKLEMPVIIDNRDLISEIPDLGTMQVISLFVSPKDKVLRVELVK
jgi:cell fate (sporulation/competence/biofilm development) regulator YlbF (YheA/YmcA/DUF963 family)